MMCVDSCSLLRDLILYMSDNKDMYSTQQYDTMQHDKTNYESVDKEVSESPLI